MSEAELIRQSLNGDDDAFAELVHLHRKNVFYHCYSIVKDEEIAEDLTQETFLHAFQHLSSFRMESKFSTWIWRIAHNLSLNYLKKQPKPEQEYHDEYPPISTKGEIPEDRLQDIKKAMEKLSPKHREVFDMYDLQGIPQKEIAARLNIPHGTVRSRLHYAREQMRKYVQHFNP